MKAIKYLNYLFRGGKRNFRKIYETMRSHTLKKKKHVIQAYNLIQIYEHDYRLFTVDKILKNYQLRILSFLFI